MKKFFLSLPDDIKQILSSLAVAIALICGSLFMLSAYIGTIAESNNSVEAVAPPAVSENAESSASSAP